MLVLKAIGLFICVFILAVMIRAAADFNVPPTIEKLPWSGLKGRVKFAYLHDHHKALYYTLVVLSLLEIASIICVVLSLIIWTLG
ncbi:hypothetical protein D3C78_1329480 [compost metagenome]